ncbi:MAG: hypothetical protein PT120_05800, partial [Aphanizomenon gracile PMC649.10]|nr:hypothetical protein [Aphanizomenon gracile PMC649.10]
FPVPLPQRQFLTPTYLHTAMGKKNPYLMYYVESYSRLKINDVWDLNSKPDSKPVLILTPDSVTPVVNII